MKCKVCKNEINLTIAGLPDDICWGCANEEEKDETLNTAIKGETHDRKIL